MLVFPIDGADWNEGEFFTFLDTSTDPDELQHYQWQAGDIALGVPTQIDFDGNQSSGTGGTDTPVERDKRTFYEITDASPATTVITPVPGEGTEYITVSWNVSDEANVKQFQLIGTFEQGNGGGEVDPILELDAVSKGMIVYRATATDTVTTISIEHGPVSLPAVTIPRVDWTSDASAIFGAFALVAGSTNLATYDSGNGEVITDSPGGFFFDLPNNTNGFVEAENISFIRLSGVGTVDVTDLTQATTINLTGSFSEVGTITNAVEVLVLISPSLQVLDITGKTNLRELLIPYAAIPAATISTILQYAEANCPDLQVFTYTGQVGDGHLTANLDAAGQAARQALVDRGVTMAGGY